MSWSTTERKILLLNRSDYSLGISIKLFSRYIIDLICEIQIETSRRAAFTHACTHCIVLVNFHEARSSERSMVHLGGFRRVILDEEVIEAEARITTRKSTARVASAPLDSLRGSYQAVTMSMVPLVSRGCNLLQPCTKDTVAFVPASSIARVTLTWLWWPLIIDFEQQIMCVPLTYLIQICFIYLESFVEWFIK